MNLFIYSGCINGALPYATQRRLWAKAEAAEYSLLAAMKAECRAPVKAVVAQTGLTWNGPEGTAVLKVLEKPATINDIINATGIGKYRVCSILLRLRLLGAIQSTQSRWSAAVYSRVPTWNSPDDSEMLQRIRPLYESGLMDRDIGAIVGMSKSYVGEIRAGAGLIEKARLPK